MHTGQTEDEDHEPLAADAQRGAAQRQSPEEPVGGGARQRAGPPREETLARTEQIDEQQHQ